MVIEMSLLNIILIILTIASIVGSGVVVVWKIMNGIDNTMLNLNHSVDRLNEHLAEVKLDQKETREKVLTHTVELEKHDMRLTAIEVKIKK